MYDRASNRDKETLRKVHDACRVLVEYGRAAAEIVDAGMEDAPGRELFGLASDFLDAVQDFKDDGPEWCNRENREDSMERAMRSAEIKLTIRAEWDYAWEASYIMAKPIPVSFSDEEEARRHARAAASLVSVALDLKAAREEVA
jgi:hypothetical protein